MTAREMATDIGKVGVLPVGGFRIPVTVLDIRKVFARIDYLVTPTDPNAKGQEWVCADRVEQLRGPYED